MTQTASELVVAPDGDIYVAPVGTALPETISDLASLDPAFAQLGFASEDGVKFTDGKTVQAFRVWQSRYPARRSITEREAMAEFQLVQWNTDTVSLAFGGGEVTEPEPGEFVYTPPPPEELDERALIVTWQDGDKNYAIVMPKGMVTENVETDLTATALAALPITFAATVESSDAPWYMLTDDPSFGTGS